MKKYRRSFVSLLTASSFVVLAVTGILAFVQPFSIAIVGLHALLGFVFVGIIALHVANNLSLLSRYGRTKLLWLSLAITASITGLFLWQPRPIRSVLSLSQNFGPAVEQFAMDETGLLYHYKPAANYQMRLSIRTGKNYDLKKPPNVAIWLENASSYHIKTLHGPEDIQARASLPYWDFKVRGWEDAKRQAAESGQDLNQQLMLDGVTSATQNSSFDPADYILPANQENPLPYRLLLEIDQQEDDESSLVYAVDIDNNDPRAFQLLDLVGYPKREEDDEGKEVWDLYFVDGGFESTLTLIDSVLLTIER